MSVGNADKGLMPAEEVKRRVQPFIDESLPLVLTQEPIAACVDASVGKIGAWRCRQWRRTLSTQALIT